MKTILAQAVLVVCVCLTLVAKSAPAPITPCQDVSLSSADATFLEWLIQEGLTKQTCRGEQTQFSGAAQPTLGTSCDAALPDGEGNQHSIVKVNLNLDGNTAVDVEELSSRLATLPCVTAIDFQAQGSAATDILTTPFLKQLPVEQVVANVEGTFMDKSMYCPLEWHAEGTVSCPVSGVRLSLPASLRSLKIQGGTSSTSFDNIFWTAMLPSLPKSLLELHIEGTKIGGKLPSELPKKIRSIKLRGNMFSGTVSESWANAAKLETYVVHEEGLRSEYDDLLDDQFVSKWPRLQELDVRYGNCVEQAGGLRVRSRSGRHPLVCSDHHCWSCRARREITSIATDSRPCIEGSRTITCIKAGERDAKLLQIQEQNRFDIWLSFGWGLPQSTHPLVARDSLYESDQVQECLTQANSNSGDVARVVDVRLWWIKKVALQREVSMLMASLPCLRGLHTNYCGWLQDGSTLQGLRKWTISEGSGDDCEGRPLPVDIKLPPQLQQFTSEVPFVSRLPEVLPVGLQDLDIRLDPGQKWVIPSSWAAATNLRVMHIKSTDYTPLQLHLSPVFSNMKKLEEVTVCTNSTIPDRTMTQLCAMGVDVNLCRKPRFHCPTFTRATHVSWGVFGGIVALALFLGVCCKQACQELHDVRPLVVNWVLALAFIGAIGANLWLAIITVPSILSSLLFGGLGLQYIGSVACLWRVSMAKYACFQGNTKGSKPGMLDMALFSWRHQGGHVMRSLKTMLLLLCGPWVMDLTGLVHMATGKPVARITSEIDAGRYFLGRFVVLGVFMSLPQAVLQTVAFNLLKVPPYNVLLTYATAAPVWVFALTLALSLASLGATVIIIIIWLRADASGTADSWVSINGSSATKGSDP